MMNKANLLNRWLRWTERLLLVVGMAALGLAGKTILEAKITQAYQTYCLEQALSPQTIFPSWVSSL